MSLNGINNVYDVRHGEGYEWLLPIDSADYAVLKFDGTARGSLWRPVRVRRFRSDDDGRPLRPCDFPYWGGGGLALTEVAKAKIESLLHGYGEFLPLSCIDGHFWAFHVTHFVDALDENASELERASDDPNCIIGIRRYAFRPRRLATDW